jgi:STAS domain
VPQRPVPEPFEVRVLAHAGAVRVEVLGQLDFATAPRLAQALGALPSGGEVVVDLAGVTLMDTTGAAVLMRARHGRNLASMPDEPIDDQESWRPPEVLRRAAVYRDDGVSWERIRERTGVRYQGSEWFAARHAAGIPYRPPRPTGREQR